MPIGNRTALLILSLTILAAAPAAAVSVLISEPIAPPAWALAERELLRAASRGAEAFAGKYLDARGHLRCVERWGGNDGADDAMENFGQWTLLHALGAGDNVLRLYDKAWEGHLAQYTEARAPGIEMAEHGMYHREFVTAFDWEHTGEALASFNLYGLSRPGDPLYRERAERFARFYTGDDPHADNYDRERKIIKSIHNGSRGAKITPAKEQDWGGLPVEGDPARLTRYSTASNIRGDHPLNLCTAALGFNAYMLSEKRGYRDWTLEYVSAWRGRVLENRGNIPTNIGLDGSIGGEWGGKWYGGVFGWNFWPESSGRNYYMRGARIAFGVALMLTGDLSFAEPLRQQINNLYAVKKVENGRVLLPNKHGGQGWYGYTPDIHSDVQRDLYLWTMDPADREKIAKDPWLMYLAGENPDYPWKALQGDIVSVQKRVRGLLADNVSPDKMPSDWPQKFNPATVNSLIELTLGGNPPGRSGNILHSRLRYFDPTRRRAGLPEDVAALVEKITPAGVRVTLVNLNPAEGRTVVLQAGAYAEHEFRQAKAPHGETEVNARSFTVRLEPGAGGAIELEIERFQHQPTLSFPWNRE